MKHCILLAMFLLNLSVLFAQTRLKGIVIDSESNKPVPFVSIGIISKADGTVSNVNGAFEISLDAAITDGDTLRFSSIGYRTKDFLVGELRKKYSNALLDVSLARAVNELKQVVIKAKHAEVKILGYQTTSKLLGLGFGANSIGSQGGVRLTVKHPNTNLESLSFFIIQNSFESLTFRVNVYEMVDGKPGNNILNDNIIFKIGDKQSGKITVDLSCYNIYVNKDVLIALEWIGAKPATAGTLDVAAVVFGSTYFRQASQYFWMKKGTGLGISVKANY
ncbi:MAG: carboxypeptidase-like regulatory domain-containing protein [Sphingobacteriales bacterium]